MRKLLEKKAVNLTESVPAAPETGSAFRSGEPELLANKPAPSATKVISTDPSSSKPVLSIVWPDTESSPILKSPTKPEKGLPLFVKLDGTVVYVEDIHSVWFTPSTLQDPLDELMDNLAKVGASLKPAVDLNPEDFYAAIYSEDGGYYRCKVLQENQGKVQVLFVDYGNHETKSRTDILELTPDFKRLQGTAFKVTVNTTPRMFTILLETCLTWRKPS